MELAGIFWFKVEAGALIVRLPHFVFQSVGCVMQNACLCIFSRCYKVSPGFLRRSSSKVINGYRREDLPADDDELEFTSEILGDIPGSNVIRYAYRGP